MGQVPSPSLTLTITPFNGAPTDYTRYLTWSGGNQEMTITQNFGRQGDTATLVLTNDFEETTGPSFAIEALSEVVLYDNIAEVNLFAGYITDVVQDVQGPTYYEWDLNCTDYTFLADNAVVQGTFVGLTVDQIVVALTQQANCGVTAATIANGGFIAPGPQLPSFVQNYDTLSNAWRNLATLAGQSTPYGWYVDENKVLHFYNAATALPSGVTLTGIPTGAAVHGSVTEGHWYYGNQHGYEQDGTSVKNRILVQGADQTFSHTTVPTGTPTDVFVGNGFQTSWALKFIVSGTPELYVNGVSTTVTVVQAGGTGSGQWQVNQNAIGAYFLTSTVAPANGTVIQIWYDYSVPVVAQAQDKQSIDLYGLTLSEFINDTSLVTMSSALARAQRERIEYAFVAERATFTTTEEWLGWVRAGWTFTYVSPFSYDVQNNVFGIDDTFICISNTITFGAGGYRQCQMTGVRI